MTHFFHLPLSQQSKNLKRVWKTKTELLEGWAEGELENVNLLVLHPISTYETPQQISLRKQQFRLNVFK